MMRPDRSGGYAGCTEGMPGETNGNMPHGTVDHSDHHSVGHHHFTHQHAVSGGSAPLHTHEAQGQEVQSADIHSYSNTGAPYAAGLPLPSGYEE